jgi:hypothetical protein
MKQLSFDQTKYGIASIVAGVLSPVLLVVVVNASPDTSLPRIVAAVPLMGFALGVLSVKTKAGSIGIFVNILVELFVLVPLLFFSFR